jgi:hypothetical protein
MMHDSFVCSLASSLRLPLRLLVWLQQASARLVDSTVVLERVVVWKVSAVSASVLTVLYEAPVVFRWSFVRYHCSRVVVV